MPSRELCDIQNEESEQLINDLRIGLRRLPSNKPYNQGEGPNSAFHDSGSGDLNKIVKKDRK